MDPMDAVNPVEVTQTQPGVAEQLANELAREARNAFEHGTGTVAVSLLSAVLVLWILRGLLRGVAGLSARLGVDRRRRFSRLARSAQLIVLLLLIGELIQSAARVAPVWVAALVVFVLIPFLLWTSGTVQDLVGGAIAHLRLHLTEGEYVRIGAVGGVLIKLGTTYLELRDEAGNVQRIPSRVLTTATVGLAAERHAVPIELELATARPLTLDEATRLREGTVTSPYRSPGTHVRVERLAAPDRVRVQFSVWSQAAVTPARRRLERALARFEAVPGAMRDDGKQTTAKP